MFLNTAPAVFTRTVQGSSRIAVGGRLDT